MTIPVVTVIREAVACPTCSGHGKDRVRCYGRGRGRQSRFRYYACRSCEDPQDGGPLRFKVLIVTHDQKCSAGITTTMDGGKKAVAT